MRPSVKKTKAEDNAMGQYYYDALLLYILFLASLTLLGPVVGQ